MKSLKIEYYAFYSIQSFNFRFRKNQLIARLILVFPLQLDILKFLRVVNEVEKPPGQKPTQRPSLEKKKKKNKMSVVTQIRGTHKREEIRQEN